VGPRGSTTPVALLFVVRMASLLCWLCLLPVVFLDHGYLFCAHVVRRTKIYSLSKFWACDIILTIVLLLSFSLSLGTKPYTTNMVVCMFF
jgi:hypothetical protein